MCRRIDATDAFSGLADTYAGHRPGYPFAAIKAALDGPPVPARAADVGCGTGISARLLAAAGAAVIAIDPNPDMLDEARRHPGAAPIEFRRAEAEATGLADGVLDLVLCAQAFHWFDPDRALREFHRVLAPGGRLALLWNVRRTDDPFGEAYERIVRRAQADAAARGLTVPPDRAWRPPPEGPFVNARTLDFGNPHPLDWPGLLGRARSASYFPRSGPLRTELEAELRRLFDEHARDGRVVLAQTAELTLSERGLRERE